MKNRNSGLDIVVSIFTLMSLISLILYIVAEKKPKIENATEAKELNNVRAKKDVPIIEENWSIIENDSPNVTWARGNKLIYTKKPFHLYKEIRYLDENRVVEIDAVHYQQSDSASYRLLITSLFEDHVDVKTKEYKLIIYHPGKFPPSKTKTLTGYAADSILNTWRSIQ